MELLALGPLEGFADDGAKLRLGGARRRAVLATLLIRAGEVVSVDRIVDDAWGDSIPANPKSAVQVAVSRLRTQVGSSRLLSRGSGYVLRIGPDELDTHVFERLVNDAQRAADEMRHEAALELLARGLALWRGSAYADFEYDEFARGEAARLEELRTTAVEGSLESQLALGRHAVVLPELEQLVASHPLRERLWSFYMLALYRSGRQSEALRAYRDAATHLGETLGIEPGPELRQMESLILLQSPELEVGPVDGKLRSDDSMPDGHLTLLAAIGSDEAAEGPLDVLRRSVAEHGGTLFEELPGQLCAAFADVSEAANAAVDAQVETLQAGRGLGIALHASDLQIQRGTYVGLGLSRVIRVAAAAENGQILVTATAAEELSPGTGRFRLAALGPRELPGMSAPEQLFALIDDRLPSVPPAPKPVAEELTNLTNTRLSSFFGRAADIAQLHSLLRTHRLVTLSGPGGVGKTRLSEQVAANFIGQQTDGVWVLSMAALDDGDLIFPELAALLGVEAKPGESIEAAVLAFCSTCELLLVFDNCEHLVDATASTIVDVLNEAARIRVLATSRERLGVPGEVVYQVSGLPYPTAKETADLDGFREMAAVALFEDRAAAIAPDFRVTLANAGAIAALCRHLDGIPLALELAASRVEALSPAQIVERLSDRFQLLAGRSAGVPFRQRTLQGVLDWSHDLLSDPERMVLRRVAVFPGGFDLRAAEAVCPDDDLSAGDVLTHLSALVAKSLVTTTRDDDSMRFALLETIHMYALSKLQLAGEDARFQKRHARHFGRTGAAVDDDVRGSSSEEALRSFRRNLDDYRAALAWFEAHDPGAGITLLGGIGLAWFKIGGSQEGRATATRLVTAHTDPVTADLCWALLALGRFHIGLGDLSSARDTFVEVVSASEVVEEGSERAALQAPALGNLGYIASFEGRLDDAAEFYRRELEVLAGTDDARLRATVAINLADVELSRGSFQGAIDGSKAALDNARSSGDHLTEAAALESLGESYLWQGNVDVAGPYLDEALRIVSERGFTELVAPCKQAVAEQLTRSGEPSLGLDLARDALRIADTSFRALVPSCLEVVAMAHAELGSRGVASVVFGAALASRTGRHDARDGSRAAYVAGLVAAHGESVTQGMERGRRISLEDAITLALDPEPSPR